jgi:hypothetical protein
MIIGAGVNMSNPEQKRIWREEKEQQLRDKQNQPREVRRRAVPLSFGDTLKRKTVTLATQVKDSGLSTDELLRRRLGI